MIGMLLAVIRTTLTGIPEVYVGQRCIGRVLEKYAKGVSVSIDTCGEIGGKTGSKGASIYVLCYGKSCPSLYSKIMITVTSRNGFGSFSGKGELVKQQYPLVNDSGFYGLLKLGDTYRNGYFTWLNETIPTEHAALLTSMLFGETQFPSELKSTMKDLGIVHVIAISGINIRYLQGLVGWITKSLKRRLRALFEWIPLLALFLIVGPAVSLLRAIVSFLWSDLGRKFGVLQRGSAVFVVFALLVLWTPSLLQDAGYWLVSAASAGIYIVVPKIAQISHKDMLKEFMSTMVIWICVTPVQWLIFGEITPIGVVVGLLISPLVEIATIGGYLGVIVRHIPGLNDLLRFLLGVIVSAMLFAVRLFHGSGSF
jgi:ComEC/Rec2-related protein